jgi:hypothetical protein
MPRGSGIASERDEARASVMFTGAIDEHGPPVLVFGG